MFLSYKLATNISLMSFSVNRNQLVLAGTETYFFCLLENMNAVTRIDAFDKSRCIIANFRWVMESAIDSSLIKRHGVERSENTDIIHLGVCRMAVAIAINR